MQSFRSFLFGSSWRIATTVTVAVALFIMAMVATPLGSYAEGLLSTFRVTKFADVSIDPSTLPDTKALERFKKPDAFGKGELITEPDVKKADTLAQAQQQAGFKPLVPTTLPSGMKAQPELIYTSTAGKATYKPDYDNIRAALDALGGTNVQLPAALRGSTLTYDFYPAVGLVYSNQSISMTKPSGDKTRPDAAPKSGDKPTQTSPLAPGQKVIALMQTASPQVTTPDGVDMNKLKDELLKLPNLPADLVNQLRSIQDVQNTLIVPLPKGKAKSSYVRLQPTDKADALVVSTLNADGSVSNEGSAVLWERGGSIYILTGNVASSELVTVAKSVK